MTPRRNEVLAFSLALLHAWVRLVPWDSTPLGTDIEASWRWVLHLAWERALVFGRDVVFTYGPYGFLLADSYHPATYRWRVGLLAAVSFVFASVLWRIVRPRVSSVWKALAWMVLLVETLAFSSGAQNLFLHVDFVLLWLGWVLRDPGDAKSRRLDGWILHGLVACVALGSLVKFTFLLAGLVPIAVLSLREIVVDKRFPRVAASFGASLLGFWFLARQPLSALGSYLATSAEVAAAYAESMGLPCPTRDIVLFVASAAVLLVLWVRAEDRSRRPWFLVHLAACAALLFLDFKSGFVRGDVPHRILAATALLFWLATAVVPRNRVPFTRMRVVTSLSAFALVLLLIGSILAANPGGGLARAATERIQAWPRDVLAASRTLTGRTRFAERDESTLEAIRRLAPLTDVRGSVDLYPARAGLVLASDLEYRPRPVFQSYCAFTPRLLRLNADHLTGPSAPDEILFTVVDWIDRRAPAMDDSLSWPILLARYDVAGAAAEHLVLRRRDRPRTLSWKPLQDRVGQFGRPMDLGDSRGGFALWAEIDLHPTAILRALAFLYRPPVLFLSVRTSGGRARSYRLVPGIAAAGFLLSPVIEEDDAFVRFASQGRSALPRDEAQVITIASPESDDLTWAYGREYTIRLSLLDLGS